MGYDRRKHHIANMTWKVIFHIFLYSHQDVTGSTWGQNKTLSDQWNHPSITERWGSSLSSNLGAFLGGNVVWDA